MAGNVMSLHRFADDVGPLPLVLLDQNYDALTLAVNTLNTYSNFYTDLGTTNAVTLQTPGTQTVAYGDGLVVMTRVAATNTGPTTLNVNNLGALPVLNPDGSQFTGGELSAGTVYSFVFNAGRNAWQIGGGGGGGSQITAPFTVVNADGHPQLELRTDGYSGITAWPSGTALNLEANGGGALGTPPSQLEWDSNGNWLFGGTSSITVPSLNAGSATIGNLSAVTGALGTAPNQLTWDAAGNFTLTGSANLPAGSFAKLTDVDLANPVMGDDGVLPDDLRMVVQRGATTPPTYTLSSVVGAPFEVAGPDGAHLRVNPDGSGWVGPHTNTGGMLAWDANGNFSFDPPVTFPLDILTNVHISGPAAGQVLTYSVNPVPGWVNATIPGFSFLNSLSLAGATTGQVMTFDGNAWVPADPGEVSVIPLTSLADVSITTPLNRQVLTWDAPNSMWVNAPAASPSLATLPDVHLSSQGQGDVLTWNAASQRWINSNVVSVVTLQSTSYGNLAGVVIANPDGSGSLGLAPSQLKWDSQSHFTLGGGATLSVPLAGLSDVALATPATGQVLAWNGTNWANAALPGGAGIDTFAALLDVNLTNPTNAQMLYYNGPTQRWVNGNPSINQLGDVHTSAPTTGQVLTYSSGTGWVNGSTVSGPFAVNGSLSVNGTLNNTASAAGVSFITSAPGSNFQISNTTAGALMFTSSGLPIGFMQGDGVTPSLTISASGNVSVNAPSSGAALTVNGSGYNVTLATASGVSPVLTWAQSGRTQWQALNDGGTDQWRIWNANSGTVLSATNTGNVSIVAPSSGVALNVQGRADSWAAQFRDPVSGVKILAGSTASDPTFLCTDGSDSLILFRVNGNGSLWAGNLGSGTGQPIIYAGGGQITIQSSTARFKRDIRSVRRHRVKETIAKLRTVSYRSTCEADDPDQTHYGLIAEEVAAVDPCLVYLDKEGRPFSVAYDRIAMLLLPLVQELLGMDEPEGEVYG